MTGMPKTASASNPAAGLAFALGGAFCYGVNMVGARFAAIEGIAGAAIIAYRSAALLALVLLVIAWTRPTLSVPKGERLAFAVLVLGTGGMGLSYLSAVSFVPVSVAAVVIYTYPVLILLASPWVTGARIGPGQLAIAAACFAGICLLVGPSFSGLDWRGLALAGLSSLLIVTQFFAAGRCPGTSQAAKLTWIHAVALPMGLSAALATGTWIAPGELARAPFAIAVAVCGYMAGIVLQLLALSRLNPVVAGFVFCLEPIVTTLIAIAVLDERLEPHQIAGVVLVLAAVAATSLPRIRRADPASAGSTNAGATPHEGPELKSPMRPQATTGEVSP